MHEISFQGLRRFNHEDYSSTFGTPDALGFLSEDDCRSVEKKVHPFLRVDRMRLFLGDKSSMTAGGAVGLGVIFSQSSPIRFMQCFTSACFLSTIARSGRSLLHRQERTEEVEAIRLADDALGNHQAEVEKRLRLGHDRD